MFIEAMLAWCDLCTSQLAALLSLVIHRVISNPSSSPIASGQHEKNSVRPRGAHLILTCWPLEYTSAIL